MYRQINNTLIVAGLMIISIFLCAYYGKNYNTTPIHHHMPTSWLTVILLPLDSRPPCTQFVDDLARTAGIKLLMPEPEILDNYKTPASREALRLWLKQNSKYADAAIISTDMLIHGSLLASRLSSGTATDAEDVLKLLSAIHQENPSLNIYAFNIIPRLLIADSQENAAYQRDMLEYSILKDKVHIFGNMQDTKKLAALEEKLPAKIIHHYITLYEQNATLNSTLTNMVEQGILKGLIIGQDDSHPFGIPNMNKDKLLKVLQDKPSLSDKVFITRGTDEVAMTLLGHIVTHTADYRPRIFVTYSTPDVAQIVMPFMPHTVAKTVTEKISIVGGQQVKHADQADFILFIHAGTKKNLTGRNAAAQRLKNLIDQGYKVALVDLTQNFQLSETLLPALIAKKVDIAKFIAYAGWNTTSNSIGSAVTQATIFNKSLQSASGMSEVLALYQNNLEFLLSRFLDDLYYQKEINPLINEELLRSQIDPYNLALYYEETNNKIKELMSNKTHWLFRKAFYNHPIAIETKEGTKKILITDLKVDTYLPWQRTFEIYLKTQLSISVINE
jgi:hypothetical protein